MTVRGTSFGDLRYSYDDAGRLASMEGAGIRQAWRRDEMGRVVGHDWSGEVPASSAITYDDAGRLTSVRGLEGTVRYAYDEVGQLVEASGPRTTQTFTYDLAGHLTSRTVTDEFGASRTDFTYDEAGQLTCVSGPDGQQYFAYDAAGRRVKESGPRGVRTYQWGPSGHLTGMVLAPGADGAAPAQWSVERDSLGLPWRLDGVEVVWDLAGGVPRLSMLADSSVTVLPGALAVGGQVAGGSWRTQRPQGGEFEEPWDAPAPVAGSGPVQVGAGGSLSVGGLELLGARAYDAATAAFLSPDPLEQSPMAAWASNPYSYAANNPLAFSDPWASSP